MGVIFIFGLLTIVSLVIVIYSKIGVAKYNNVLAGKVTKKLKKLEGLEKSDWRYRDVESDIANLRRQKQTTFLPNAIAGGLFVFAVIILAMNSFTIVEKGHNKVATFLGAVQPTPYPEGFHIVNPILRFTTFDLRDITYTINDISVPSQDKLKSQFDVSFIIAAKGSGTPKMLQTAGDLDLAVEKYLVPKARSVLREAGKKVQKSQDFFLADVQMEMQENLENGMSEFLDQRGFIVKSILIRDIDLPQIVQTAIKQTKERQEQVNREQAALDIVEKQAQQKVKQAEADAQAAEEQAKKIKTLADADAYAVEVKATAQANANNRIAKSVTANLIKYNSIEKWDGAYPKTLMSGKDSGVLLTLPTNK